jgi:hypothetical protein
MGKVSIGLHGWRFDESEIFTDDGEWRPVMEIPEETRQRLLRLQVVIGKPCDACYLVYGEENKRRCNEAEIVYGEPLDEVVLCGDHEADFLYWFRECGGESLAGEETFRDAFHEWFDAGDRAPDGYGGLEHVAQAPDELPDLPDPEDVYERERELLADERPEFDGETADDGERRDEAAGDDLDSNDDAGPDDLDTDDLDLGRDYPS